MSIVSILDIVSLSKYTGRGLTKKDIKCLKNIHTNLADFINRTHHFNPLNGVLLSSNNNIRDVIQAWGKARKL